MTVPKLQFEPLNFTGEQICELARLGESPLLLLQRYLDRIIALEWRVTQLENKNATIP